MKPQNYKNHAKYYFAHHFIFYPLILTLFVIAISGMVNDKDHFTEWAVVSGLVAMLAWFSFIVRQHYALISQDRIVRLELRLRYYQLTQQRFEKFESQLTIRQIVALRFAGDEELPPLVKKAIAENLSPRAIKRSIQQWQPDYMRV